MSLKPCPFCGHRYKGDQFVWKGAESRFECSGCGALGPFPDRQSPVRPQLGTEWTDEQACRRDILAIEAWNRRVK